MQKFTSLMVVTLLAGAHSFQQAELPKAATRAWSDYESKALRFSAEISFKETEFNDPTRFRAQAKTVVRQSPQAATSSVQYISASKKPTAAGDVRTQAFNEDYYFELITKPDDEKSVLKRIDKRDYQYFDAEVALLRMTIKRVTVPLRVFDLYLPKAILEPGFQVDEITEVNKEGTKLVRLVFRYEPGADSKSVVRSGKVLLDPGRSWLIREWSASIAYKDGGKSEIRQENSFGELEDGTPVLTGEIQSIDATLPKEGTVKHQRITEYRISASDVDPKVFRLSNYGHSEPALPVVRSRSGPMWVFWSLGGSLLCIILALLARHWRRSHKFVS